ncbi:hypothetical protein ACNTMW_25155 [Planosporangium sp. 12N6]|uniref:hypothetical protein n=1 Tax=Planosporangium spinosum TaxID=3402278 RepID=UPI003CFA0E00
MTGLPYDPTDPPLDPPAECRHELMWRLARALWEAHEASADRFCLVGACQRGHYLHPCRPAQLAQDGMRTACLPSCAPRAVGE